MTRSFLVFVVASCLAASAARADIPYWQFRSGGFSEFVRTIAVDPTDPDIVYIGVTNAATPWGGYDNEAGTGVFRSTDAGSTWTPRNAGLPSGLVTALVIDPSAPNVLYAGVDGGGIFKTTDAAATWVPANNGLTNLDVYALAIDPATPSTLYAGAEAGGVFRSLDGRDLDPCHGLRRIPDRLRLGARSERAGHRVCGTRRRRHEVD
jgi:hypothetical protein